MSVRKAIFWAFLGQIFSFLAAFGATVALARILSPREIGIYAVGLAVTGILQAISAFGVGSYIVREREPAPETIATAFTINAIISVVLGAILYLASFSPALTLGEPMVGEVLRLLALVPLIGVLEFRPATMLQREMRFRAISIVTVSRTVATALVSIAAALLGASALSSAYGGLAGAVIGAGGFMLAARHHVALRLSLHDWRPMTAFGMKTLSISGISVLTMRFSDVVLGRIAGITALGFYSRASALSNVIFQNIYGSFTKVLFVKLANDDRAGAGLRTGYIHALDLLLALMWPMLAGIAIFSNPVVTILFGERWLSAALPLAILMIAQALYLTFAMNYELFVLRDESGRQARYEVVRSILGLAAFAYGCTFGLVGAASARLADGVVAIILYVPQMRRLVGAERGELGRVFARNGGVTLAAIGPGLVLMWLNGWAPATNRWAIGATVAGGIMLWLIALRILDHPLYREGLRFMALRRGARPDAVPSFPPVDLGY